MIDEQWFGVFAEQSRLGGWDVPEGSLGQTAVEHGGTTPARVSVGLDSAARIRQDSAFPTAVSWPSPQNDVLDSEFVANGGKH